MPHLTPTTPVSPSGGILRRDAVLALTGLSRSGMYDLIAKGLFPQPVRLGKRRVGWVDSEVYAWIAGCPRGTLAPPQLSAP